MPCEKWGIRQKAIILILVGLLLFFFAVFVLEDSAWAKLVESIASAIFIFGLVSILLEFEDFTNYVSRIFQKQLLDREYIKGLKEEQLQILKRDVDAEILGAPSIGQKKDFYQFLGITFDQLLKANFREHFSINCNYQNHSDDYFIRRISTRYRLVKGYSEDQPLSIVWRQRSRLLENCASGHDLTQSQKLCKKEIRKLHIKFGDKEFFLDPNSFSDDDKPLVLKSRNEGDEAPSLEQNVQRRGDSYLESQYALRYEYPESRNFEHGDFLYVTFEEEVLIPSKLDTNYVLRMSCPTYHLSMNSTFPEGISAKVHPLWFVLPGSSQGSVKEQGERGTHSVFQVIDNWCLPGHGVVVTWELPLAQK